MLLSLDLPILITKLNVTIQEKVNKNKNKKYNAHFVLNYDLFY